MGIRGIFRHATHEVRHEVDRCAGRAHFGLGWNRRALHPKSGNASIRVDLEAEMSRSVWRSHFELKCGVALPACARNHLGPLRRRQVFIGSDTTGFEAELFGEVSGEEGGVDGHRVDSSRRAQGEQTPVMAGPAAAASLPAIHPLAAIGVLVLLPDRWARLEQVDRVGEELVIAVHDPAPHRRTDHVSHLAPASFPNP